MSKQCLDISQMQHLKELGVDTSKASAAQTDIWVTSDLDEFQKAEDVLVFSESESDYFEFENPIKKFTLQDILDLLPKDIKTDDSVVESRFFLFVDFQYEQVSYSVDIAYEGMFDYKVFKIGECPSLIDAAYEMLCWVIENGYLEVKQNEGI